MSVIRRSAGIGACLRFARCSRARRVRLRRAVLLRASSATRRTTPPKSSLVPGMMAEMDREDARFRDPRRRLQASGQRMHRRAVSAAARLVRAGRAIRSYSYPATTTGSTVDARGARRATRSSGWRSCARSSFRRDATLGQKRLALERQAKRGYPEHLRWTVERHRLRDAERAGTHEQCRRGGIGAAHRGGDRVDARSFPHRARTQAFRAS